MIESDHKSLEQISMKNLADAPVRLQRMLLRLQDYDFTIKYRPGNEMVVADTLSRYSPEDTSEILLDISLNHVYIDPEKKQDYQLAIQDDPLLRALAEIILAGWPDNIEDVPKALRPYHGQRDSLTIEDGLILRGEAIIVPPGERRKILEQIHQGHQGISKCQNRARQCVYWPGINKDIERLVEACPTCQRHQPQEPRQPLKPTPPPHRPWQHLGADFMSFDGSEYLVIVDYYSKMPIVRKMPTSQCTAAKPSCTSRSYLLNTEFQNPSGQTMDHSSPVTCSRSLQKSGTSLITRVPLPTLAAMDRLSQQSRSSKVCSPDQSVQEKIHISHSWLIEVHLSIHI